MRDLFVVTRVNHTFRGLVNDSPHTLVAMRFTYPATNLPTDSFDTLYAELLENHQIKMHSDDQCMCLPITTIDKLCPSFLSLEARDQEADVQVRNTSTTPQLDLSPFTYEGITLTKNIRTLDILLQLNLILKRKSPPAALPRHHRPALPPHPQRRLVLDKVNARSPSASLSTCQALRSRSTRSSGCGMQEQQTWARLWSSWRSAWRITSWITKTLESRGIEGTRMGVPGAVSGPPALPLTSVPKRDSAKSLAM